MQALTQKTSKKLTKEKLLQYSMTLNERKLINALYMDLQRLKDGPHILEDNFVRLSHPLNQFFISKFCNMKRGEGRGD